MCPIYQVSHHTPVHFRNAPHHNDNLPEALSLSGTTPSHNTPSLASIAVPTLSFRHSASLYRDGQIFLECQLSQLAKCMRDSGLEERRAGRGVMTKGHIAPRPRIYPTSLTFQTSTLTITPARLPDVTSLSTTTCPRSTLPERSVQSTKSFKLSFNAYNYIN